MKITVVCDILGEENNGAAHAAMNLIRAMMERGHQVKVVCPDENRKGLQEYYVLPKRNLWLIDKLVKKIGVTIAKPDAEILEDAIKDADVVHIHLPFPAGVKAIEIAKQHGIPTTASFHMQAENFSSYFNLQKLKPVNKSIYYIINKYVYSKVDAIHYPTQFIRDIFESNIKGGGTTNGYVISNGVDAECHRMEVEKPAEFKDKFVILSTGRYSHEKAQDVLIKAVGKSKYKDQIQLIFAGQGLKEKHYKKLSKHCKILPPIFKIFSRPDLIKCLNYADLYVHPARVELEGIACLEAIRCGKATIVSDSEKSATKLFAVDERCVFKNDDSADLAEKIDYFIENPEFRKEIGEKYFKYGEIFEQKACMDQMEQMFKDVIAAKKQ